VAAAVNAKRKGETFEPVTMGHLRGHGVTRLLVYCGSINCYHCATLGAAGSPMNTLVRDLMRRASRSLLIGR